MANFPAYSSSFFLRYGRSNTSPPGSLWFSRCGQSGDLFCSRGEGIGAWKGQSAARMKWWERGRESEKKSVMGHFGKSSRQSFVGATTTVYRSLMSWKRRWKLPRGKWAREFASRSGGVNKQEVVLSVSVFSSSKKITITRPTRNSSSSSKCLLKILYICAVTVLTIVLTLISTIYTTTRNKSRIYDTFSLSLLRFNNSRVPPSCSTHTRD